MISINIQNCIKTVKLDFSQEKMKIFDKPVFVPRGNNFPIEFTP